MTSSRKIVVTEDIAAALQEIIINAFRELDSDQFTVGLSGGSFVAVLAQVLPRLDLTSEEWSKWIFYFVDERLVPFTEEESTFRAYKDSLLPALPQLGLNQFIVINPNLKSTQEVAFDYFSKMKHSFALPKDREGFPRLNLVLLGMGPDGHTASLFPDHPLLQVSHDHPLSSYHPEDGGEKGSEFLKIQFFTTTLSHPL